MIKPTSLPTSHPSRLPTIYPSDQPSDQPSSQPSQQPKVIPSSQPSQQPQNQPSQQPIIKPSKQPQNTPSTQPTKQPFVYPSKKPIGQPTSQPSPKFSTPYSFIINTTMLNIDSSSLDNKALTTFKNSMASTMKGVNPSNILVISVLKNIKRVSSLRRRLTSEKVMPFYNEEILSLEKDDNFPNFLVDAVSNDFVVQWNISIVLQVLGYSSSTSAFNSLTSQISSSTNDGSLNRNLKAGNPIVYANAVISNIFYNILLPTYLPTKKPSYQPTYEPTYKPSNKPISSSSSSDNNTLAMNIGIGVGVGVFGIFLLVLLYLYARRTKVTTLKSLKKKDTINKDTTNNIPSYITYESFRKTNVAFVDNPSRRTGPVYQFRPKVERSLQKSYF
jgi:hypothetical protein